MGLEDERPPVSSPIADNLEAVRSRIAAALHGQSRAVRLVAVSKRQPVAAIAEAHAAGQRDFGENYVQESLAKIAALALPGLAWHFIGSLQGNKAREVARHFDWFHGLDRLSLATALSRHRPPERGPLAVLIQVNISAEATKGGVAPGEAPALAREVAALPGLALRGLMGMASPTADPAAQRREFAVLRREYEQVREAGFALDTLSMGMSQDLEAAIAEGSTLVRIGTAIFGERVAA
jgi:PLP dependent protein